MSGKVFINYRRGDDAGFTQALYLRLEDEFGSGDLFMDVEGHIKPGDDFVDVLSTQVAKCDVLLVVIGPRWAELLARRAGDKDDFVAVEIKAALDQGKRVIPVLVNGAAMPTAEALPETIRPLSRRNAVGLRPDRFRADCQGLIAALKDSLAAAERERAARTEADRHAAEMARQQAEAQAAVRAKAAEERVRAQTIAGLSADEIRKAEELANWDFVKERKDVQDLRDHLARFPGGTTERYALTRLEALAWSNLGAAPTMAQLSAYAEEFPKGANTEIAWARIVKLKQQAEEAIAVAERARVETEAWGAIAASTDRTEVEAFLRRWPSGQHASAAGQRLRELDSKGYIERLASVSPTLACALLGGIGGALALGPLGGATISVTTNSSLQIFAPIFAGAIVGLAQFVWARTPGYRSALGGLVSALGWAAGDIVGMVSMAGLLTLTLPQLFLWGAINAAAVVAGILLFNRTVAAMAVGVVGVIIGGTTGLVYYRATEASELMLSNPAIGAVVFAPIMAVVGLICTVARRGK